METKLLSTDRPIAIYYAFHSDLISYSVTDDSHCSVSLNGGWKLINTTIGKLSFKETPSESEAGTKFVTQISGTIPGHDDTTPENVRDVSGRKLIIRLEYKSGRSRIIGNGQTGPRMYITANSSTTTYRNFSSTFENSEPSLWLQ